MHWFKLNQSDLSLMGSATNSTCAVSQKATNGGFDYNANSVEHTVKTYSVTIVTSVPWDTERVLRLVKTHMGKCLFSPELKSYLITQWNCTTIGSCRCRKRTNGSAAELHEPMATIRANIPAETGGASGYISGRFAIGSSGLLRLKRRLSRAATWHGKVRSTRSVSQGTEVTIVTEYVPYRYSTRTASCKDAYGNWI